MGREEVVIDGSTGEGGGQVVRTSLALSLVTGKPVRLWNIRAGRKRTGLLRQHLAAVRAAAKVGNARTSGDALGSMELVFEPGEVRGGTYRFAVESAGSATLVLQAVLPALMQTEEPSRLALEGGTHNPWAPPFEFLETVFLPLLNRMGPKVEVALERHGFYPAGAGRFTAKVEPAKRLEPVDLPERGGILSVKARALVARLPAHIGHREIDTLIREGVIDAASGSVETVDSAGPGNALLVEIEAEHATELAVGFGMRGVRAEEVAKKTAKAVRGYLDAGAPVGPHLADQLLLPLALAGGGSFRTCAPTKHATTNAEVIGRFLDVRIAMERQSEAVWRVRVEG